MFSTEDVTFESDLGKPLWRGQANVVSALLTVMEFYASAELKPFSPLWAHDG